MSARADVRRPSAGSEEILRLEAVGRRYRRWIQRPVSLKETVVRRLRGQRSEYEELWALRDVSLGVRRGEVLGLCGANGAGKSTLLKVAARILPPSRGRVVIRGRIAALLDLGAGFLPDLSGRENIRLNGAILGMDDEQVQRKLDSIVAFADLGRFLDSPVRTYSAGMYVRLGFAIASHVEADVLLLDEVLAVGDAEFQVRCLDWLAGLRRRGTTVLLASHALPTLASLCDRVVWLDRGRIAAEGEPRVVLDRYAPGRTPEATTVASS